MNPIALNNIETISSSLLDRQGVSVVVIDLNWKIQYANSSAVQFYGTTLDKLLKGDIWALIPKSDKARFQILLNQVCQHQKEFEFQFKDKNQWRRTMIYPISAESDRIEALALCSSDITEQVETEEKLKRVLLKMITVQEDERNRISQDLHDDVGQKMTVINFELRTIREMIVNNQPIALKDIDSVIQNMGTVIKHVRQIFYQLHPPSLNKMELPKVLEAFCSTFEESNALNVDFSCEENFPELPETYEKIIYRFVQEGLNNVMKHARATSAWVTLDYSEGDINFSIEDNGQGFVMSDMVEGFGLQGIRERLLLLKGGMEIDSLPRKGTRLSGSIPFVVINL
jgi:PAS domain S-box-containing protein